jgi:hypothetical protein
MAQLIWLREQIERALRLARATTDPALKKELETQAAHYTALADNMKHENSDASGRSKRD